MKEITKKNLSLEMEDIARRLNLNDTDEALFFPKYFQIETSRVCNAKCPFCAVEQSDQSTPFMPDSLFNKVVKELSDYSNWIEWVCISRAGEPLMDKKIAERIRMLRQAGIKRVNLSTNVSLLTEKKSRELFEAGLNEIMLSIDSIDKEIYSKMRVGLSYERVINNIEMFFKLRDKIMPEAIIRVRGVSFFNLNKEDQKKELSLWENFWKRLKKPQDRIYMKRAHNWGNQKVWEGHTPQYDLVYHPCILPWSTLHITTNGIASVCPNDYDGKMNLGDINVESIANVWRGDQLERLRTLHSTGKRNDISFCQGCLLFDEDFSLEKKEY